ncbi:MAG: hypothetical protein AVDCRST_MAG77-196 [uncultured Chloroflexi bacterium]|uniref:DUF7710 domain-containing protein n=1 Tax=uncultured Chloroflexota bacterium TaxID=166587 RepID=A0A6J4H954_9CHLR|nr:MAG: hypothetical protein AVDCRST_MAG77-196 [uncultured Chloroflexota bacterium]
MGVGAYEWAVERGHFKPRRQEQRETALIENFACGWRHEHYERGADSGSAGDVEDADRVEEAEEDAAPEPSSRGEV